jgi:hypothetical protein
MLNYWDLRFQYDEACSAMRTLPNAENVLMPEGYCLVTQKTEHLHLWAGRSLANVWFSVAALAFPFGALAFIALTHKVIRWVAVGFRD